MPFYRDLFTGELRERKHKGEGRQVIARIEPPPSAVTKRSGSVWGRPWKSEALAVPIEQIGEFNEGAAPGARYVPHPRRRGYAHLECDSRAARAAETKRRGLFDRSGGYTDAQPSEL